MQSISKKSDSLIILTFSLALLFAMGTFFFSAQRQGALNDWTLSFSSPRANDNLDFVLQNSGNSRQLTWEVWVEKTEIRNGTMTLQGSEQKKIPVSVSEMSGKKVLIRVTANQETREIYKIIP